ncbi:MAG: U32 family peptidase [Alphaproteobacteria bacterium]|jgi:collagenase-like PrtC family protease|nr:U32 family peptidase [Alphaproteobacteria bacterium]
MTDRALELALGPCFFNWSPERLRDFYARIADEAPVERVYLGEVVCGKRAPLTDELWPELVERLERAGKTVVTALPALAVTERERRAAAETAARAAHVEINDLGALGERAGEPFAVGPFVNVYNQATLALLRDRGGESWCPPVELPLAEVATIAAAVPEVAVELFAFGRAPLALSARCHHARAHGRAQEGCRYVCAGDGDGLAVATLDDRPVLAVNGLQTLSHGVQRTTLAPGHLAAAGVRRLRLSPHDLDMVAVASIFRALLDGALTPNAAAARLEALGLPGATGDAAHVDGPSRHPLGL